MKFCRHLQENNQDYLAHARDALMYSCKSFLASVSFFMHAVLPCTFEHTGSALVSEVHEFIQEKDRLNNARASRIVEDANDPHHDVL
jgi:hypothetical protein